MRIAAALIILSTLLCAAARAGQPVTTAEKKLDLFAASRFAEPGRLTLQEPTADRKKPALAAIYSLLLPGMGEVYAGNFSSGKYFLIAEGALWLTFTTFEVYGNSLRDDSRSYAVAHAGVNTAGKDDQFFVDIGNFLNTNDYNEKQLRDRQIELLYDPAAGYAWQWESDEMRSEYRTERIRAERMYNNKKFVVAAIIINHVASAINAARGAISHNSDLTFRAGLLGSITRPHGIILTVERSL
jgi:hypothetical protein